MKKHLSIAAACLALTFAGCSLTTSGGGSAALPQVGVTDNRITVSPEPLRFGKDQKDVQIVWQLPKGSALRFAANGIVIDGEITDRAVKGGGDTPSGQAPAGAVSNRDQKEIVDCRIRNEGLEFTCLNRHTRPGVYKYTIRVVQAGTTIELDPTLMND